MGRQKQAHAIGPHSQVECRKNAAARRISAGFAPF
jgi:hypothetical protein